MRPRHPPCRRPRISLCLARWGHSFLDAQTAKRAGDGRARSLRQGGGGERDLGPGGRTASRAAPGAPGSVRAPLQRGETGRARLARSGAAACAHAR